MSVIPSSDSNGFWHDMDISMIVRKRIYHFYFAMVCNTHWRERESTSSWVTFSIHYFWDGLVLRNMCVFSFVFWSSRHFLFFPAFFLSTVLSFFRWQMAILSVVDNSREERQTLCVTRFIFEFDHQERVSLLWHVFSKQTVLFDFLAQHLRNCSFNFFWEITCTLSSLILSLHPSLKYSFILHFSPEK